MADSDKDIPENRGIKGAWNSTLGRRDEKGNSVALLATGYTLGNVFARGDGEAFRALFMLSALSTGIITGGLEIWEQVAWDSQGDTAVIMPLGPGNMERGYSAIESDAKSYLLIRQNESWRVYQRSSGAEVQYVSDPVAAAAIVTRISGELTGAVQTAANPATASLSGLPRNMIFSQISIPYGNMQSATPNIARFTTEGHNILTSGESIPAQYARIANNCQTPQADIKPGRYGFTQDEVAAIQPAERFLDGAFTKAKYTAASIAGLWLATSLFFGIGEAVEKTSPGRRRREKPEKKK
jgi:hypothetical protein